MTAYEPMPDYIRRQPDVIRIPFEYYSMIDQVFRHITRPTDLITEAFRHFSQGELSMLRFVATLLFDNIFMYTLALRSVTLAVEKTVAACMTVTGKRKTKFGTTFTKAIIVVAFSLFEVMRELFDDTSTHIRLYRASLTFVHGIVFGCISQALGMKESLVAQTLLVVTFTGLGQHYTKSRHAAVQFAMNKFYTKVENALSSQDRDQAREMALELSIALNNLERAKIPLHIKHQLRASLESDMAALSQLSQIHPDDLQAHRGFFFYVMSRLGHLTSNTLIQAALHLASVAVDSAPIRFLARAVSWWLKK